MNLHDSPGVPGGSGRVVHLSLGSNVGDRERTLLRAIELINLSPGVDVVEVSAMYRTEPIGFREQPEFLNCCATLRSELDPEQLLDRFREIEQALGRRPRDRWREREIDIDILLAGDLVLVTDTLTVPHPEMHRRRFVLAPLAEIAPEARHPILEASVIELLRSCVDTSFVHKVDRNPDSILPS